tara:strand:+ start:63 stop:680 length:618 start_codon:yes stop_codon:yes gene_type:complete
MSLEVLPLFSTPLYVANDGEMPEVDDDILDFEKMEYPEDFTTSTGDITKDPHILKKLPQLQTWVFKHIHEYVYGVSGVDSTKHEAEITNSWINIMFKGQNIEPHDHANSMYSGVCFLNAPKGGGDLTFHKNRYTTLQPHLHHKNLFNSTKYTISPENGMICIFPSDLIHYVTPCNQEDPKEPRISLSFNIICRGQYGDQTKLLTI